MSPLRRRQARWQPRRVSELRGESYVSPFPAHTLNLPQMIIDWGELVAGFDRVRPCEFLSANGRTQRCSLDPAWRGEAFHNPQPRTGRLQSDRKSFGRSAGVPPAGAWASCPRHSRERDALAPAGGTPALRPISNYCGAHVQPRCGCEHRAGSIEINMRNGVPVGINYEHAALGGTGTLACAQSVCAPRIGHRQECLCHTPHRP